MPSDPRTALLLRAIAPIAPDSILGGRIVLETIELQPDLKLSFRDLKSDRFGVRLLRSQPGSKYCATAGRLDLIFDVVGTPAPAVDRFVRTLAKLIRKNMASVSDAELDLLFPRPGIANGYLRRHEAIGQENIIDIGVGDRCNLFCTFCTDLERGPGLIRPTAFWRDELARARAKGKAGVLISGNEPTLRSDIPEIVAEARRLGFTEIELGTAGVRLADRRYLAELLDAGLNVVAVSIHGSNAETDGGQTGRPGFFEPKRRGFENFVALVGDRAMQEKKGVYLKTITIFTRQNLADIPALVAFLLRHEVSYALLCYPWIKGDALNRFDEVVPDYASVMKAIKPIRPQLLDPAARVRVANLPPCVASDLPCGRTVEKDTVSPAADTTVSRKLSLSDPTLTYADPCTTCAARAECGGVPMSYIKRYGTTGLRTL